MGFCIERADFAIARRCTVWPRKVSIGPGAGRALIPEYVSQPNMNASRQMTIAMVSTIFKGQPAILRNNGRKTDCTDSLLVVEPIPHLDINLPGIIIVKSSES
jgi:hypothetical protein